MNKLSKNIGKQLKLIPQKNPIRINLSNNVNDLYEERTTSLKKEMEEDCRRWKNLPCSWICRINIVTMAILPNAI
jgi:hypothetical protein